jgi:hypothetical protein
MSILLSWPTAYFGNLAVLGVLDANQALGTLLQGIGELIQVVGRRVSCLEQ